MKYALVTEVRTEASDVEWWMDQSDRTESLRIFDSFEEAKTEMRKAITRLAKNCDFFPLEGGVYVPLEEYSDWEDEGLDLLRKVVSDTIRKPNYFCAGTDLAIQCTDDADHYYAFVGTPDLLLADCEGSTLRTNVHVMTDAEKTYYFSYTEYDDEGRAINGISLCLYNDSKKRKVKPGKETRANYEILGFGRYAQDAAGREATPLAWRVLDRKDGMMLLITEKIVDFVQFSAKNDNDWDQSDLRKWLNGEFADRTFNERQKAMIANVVSGDKVFLLSGEDYSRYFPTPNDARAGYTDYARRLKEEAYHTKIREPYGFWWLRTANTGCDKADGYVWHVCNNGTPNPYERAEYSDGVRPAIWVSEDILPF